MAGALHAYPCSAMRILLLSFLMVVAVLPITAQSLSGTITAPGVAGGSLVLLATRGSAHVAIDSTRISTQGAFEFGEERMLAPGFYQLALNDSDRVDVILNGKERMVVMAFSGSPLQGHVTVLQSAENQRLWRYKVASRETQSVQETVAREKSLLDPLDHRRILYLDSVERGAVQSKERLLQQLVSEDPNSYFAKVVKTGAAIDRSIPLGPVVMASIFDFSDASLLRSSIYDKAVMAFLQSVNVVSEEQMSNAADTLLRLASRNADCEAYMIGHLVDLFSAYGPQSTVQHLVDNYLAGESPRIPMSAELRDKVDRLLQVSIGATGPDVSLKDTLGTFTPLSKLLTGHTYGALFFYSSTCDHCHAQMPGLNRIYAEFHAKGLEVLGVALDDDRTDFRPNIAQRGLKFPCFSEFSGWGSQAAKAYEVKATPTLILLDGQLRIVAKPYDAQALEEELRRRLP